jgi:hypothetical protein
MSRRTISANLSGGKFPAKNIVKLQDCPIRFEMVADFFCVLKRVVFCGFCWCECRKLLSPDLQY